MQCQDACRLQLPRVGPWPHVQGLTTDDHMCSLQHDTRSQPSLSRNHGLRLRSHPRGKLSARPYQARLKRGQHPSTDNKQLQRRDSRRIQSNLKQSMGGKTWRLPRECKEAGAIISHSSLSLSNRAVSRASNTTTRQANNTHH